MDRKEIGKLVMTKELVIKWTVLMIPTLIVLLIIMGSLFIILTGRNGFGIVYNSSDSYLEKILLFSVLGISTVIFHELIHGIFMSKYGGKPRYGISIAHWILPVAYATTDSTFRRNQYITIALAPLLLISFVCIVFIATFPDYAEWMIIPLTFNSMGAVGDLWMISLLLRMPEHVLVQDNIAELTFYGKPSDHQMNISSHGLILNFAKGFTAGFVIIILFILVYSLYQSEKTGEGLSLSFHFSPLFPVSILMGLVYSIIESAHKPKKE